MNKICNKCKDILVPDVNWNKGNIKQGLLRCKFCISKEMKIYYKNNKSYVKDKLRQYRITNARQVMLSRIKTKCREFNIEFNLDLDDILIPEKCPVFNTPFVIGTGQNKYSPSLDRIDCTKGYVKGNVQVISFLANTMKSNATNDELIQFAKWIDKLLISRYVD